MLDDVWLLYSLQCKIKYMPVKRKLFADFVDAKVFLGDKVTNLTYSPHFHLSQNAEDTTLSDD